MPTPQRLPFVGADDGTWGNILRLYLMKEHYDDGTDNSVNGGHKNITIQPGTATAGTAPLKFASGTLLASPEAGSIEFNSDSLYVTQTTGSIRKKIAAYDDSSGATGDIYYRDGSGYFTRLGIGSSNDILSVASGIPTWSSTLSGKTLDNTNVVTVKDSNFTLQDNGDVTKQARFQLSSISASATRTLTVPNADGTIALKSDLDSLASESELEWTARKVGNHRVPAARTTYFDKPDTIHSNMPTSMDTGQAISYVSGSSAGDLFIDGGKLKFTAGGAGNAAGYVAFDAGSDMTRIGIRFSFDDTGRTTDQGAVCIAMTNMILTWANFGNPAFRIGAHLVVGPDFWELTTYDASSNTFTSLGTGLLSHNLATDGAIYEVEMYRTGSTVTILLPDGQIKKITSPNIANWTSTYGFYETYCEVSATDIIPGITEAWFDTGVQYHPTTASLVTYEDLEGVVTAERSASATLTNKTLDAAKANYFLDANSNPMFNMVPTASAVNYTQISNQSTGNGPAIYPEGNDTNIDFNIGSKNAGKVKINGSEATTASVTQTLTNKTLTAPKITGTTIFPQTANIELYNTSDETTNYEKAVVRYTSNVLEVGHIYGGTASSRSVRFGTGAAAGVLNRYIQIQATPPFVSYQWSGTVLNGQAVNIGSGNSLLATSGNQTALGIDPTINQSGTASYTALLVNPTETGTGSGAKLLADFQVGGTSKVKIDNTGVITAAAAGTSSGSVATIDGTQTFTNKTLTNPKVNEIKDTNGNPVLGTYAIPSAVNFVYVTNQSTTNFPTLGVDGSDTNIGLAIAPKGNGPIRIFTASGQTPTLEGIDGSGNTDLNLKSNGTGKVKANGVEVVTISGSQILSGKTLASPVINGTITGSGASATPASGILTMWDSNKNFSANAFISVPAATATANSTTTLTVASAQVQTFYGTSNQTVKLPTTSVQAGAQYTIVNQDSGTITVQASDGTTIGSFSTGAATFTSGVSVPTTSGNWIANYIAPGKMLYALNSIKIAGTDDTTMTFPSTSGTVVTTSSSQTLTGKTINFANNTIAGAPYDILGFVQTLATRATGVGDNSLGLRIARNCTLTSVTYRCVTADASGNLVVELRKNGSAVSGTSATIAAASQLTGGTSTGSWSFVAGDILTVYITGVGTTPGRGLVADITGVTA